MVNSHDKSPGNSTPSLILEDQINLSIYFNTLWKHKLLITLGTLIPTLATILLILNCPTYYQTTYTFDVKRSSDVESKRTFTLESDISGWKLDEKNFTILKNVFYCSGNMDKIKEKHQGKSIDCELEVWPPFTKPTLTKITKIEQLQQIRNIQAAFLKATITAQSQKELKDVALTVKNNITNAVHLQLHKHDLINETVLLRNEMVKLDRENFDLNVKLTEKNITLAYLKESKEDSSTVDANTLQFQLNTTAQPLSNIYIKYLPVETQVSAVKFEIAETKSLINSNKFKYDHHEKLVEINESLINELDKMVLSGNPTQEFLSFVKDLKNSETNENTKDYLDSNILQISNRVLASNPISESPPVITITPKYAQKTLGAFVISLTLSIIAAFLITLNPKTKKT